MQILDNLFDPHLKNLQRALDRASARQAAVTANIANVNTPGYKRRDLDFDIELEEARSRRQGFGRPDSLEPTVDHGSVRLDQNSVDLEREVVALAETELRYQISIDFANRYFEGLKNVIREGR
jgi:flagellar basal-body rod protein FlgB